MSSRLLIFVIFFVGSIRNGRMDCGCNKMKRDAILTEPDEIQIAAIENKIKSDDMALIEGGKFWIGTDTPIFKADNEAPEKEVTLPKFYLDKHEVSNGEFRKFVEATGYVTEAEKFGDSFIFKQHLSEEVRKEFENFRVVKAEWWYKVKDASWKHPVGLDSDLVGKENFPVIHVSWNDAVAYCKWQKKRLPSEAEWETACRGGKRGKLFPWGNKFMPRNEHWMNIWQGEFPDGNVGEDGYPFLCPVDRFRQNEYDLYNIVGNVWEWTADLWNARDKGKPNSNRVRKGGSYLCHESYCYRYRCAARSQNTEDSSADNLGFRCAKDFEPLPSSNRDEL